MNPLEYLRSLVTRKPANAKRGYQELAAVGGVNSDWPLQQISEDADLYQNAYLLTGRMRDLFKTNPIYIKWRESLWANVFGEAGITLRMKIKETEDRVIHTPDEKAVLDTHERRINRVREWAARQNGNAPEQYRAYRLADELETRGHESGIERVAMVQVGAPDVFANQLVERKWKEWQRAEFCDVRGTRNYHVLRQLRLLGGVRDGDLFHHLIKNTKVNKFGFSLKLINSEWCDRFLNDELPNGNVVRMGIEYEHTPWGIGKAVAYYFIKRQPRDWQWNSSYMRPRVSSQLHDRIPASEIIHYARAVDAEGTRPAPWAASTIPKARQLNEYEIAEVVAAREQACKIGHYYSDVANEDFTQPNADGLRVEEMGPGDKRVLPWGWKYQGVDPTHPNGNFESFRKGMLRSQTAGMPGADYNQLASDLENINFSAGRLGRLDTNETSKLLQRFDIDTAETPIFEAFLEMALITGEIPLPLAKFSKFNRPLFQGRRWAQVDEVKAVTAAALRVANGFSSDPRECDNESVDFEEIALEQAEANMFKQSLGLGTAKTVEKFPAPVAGTDEDAPEVGEDVSTDTTAAAENGDVQGAALNGAQITGLLEIISKVTQGEIDAATATALIAASFPLMTSEEISAIVSGLSVQETEDDPPEEPTGDATNGKAHPKLSKKQRLTLA